ncbi:MAG: ribosome assembly RNA-binding protein YhbY [Clostridia bacterium]|nr:ribosome assembly RNA-binding protein YhbY [Clostridia bacterium]
MLTSKQRAQLRALANPIDTIMQVGKGGITENLITTVSDALEARELIKLRVLENSDETPRSAAEALAEAVGADVVAVIGTRFVLYRESEKHKRIELVK